MQSRRFVLGTAGITVSAAVLLSACAAGPAPAPTGDTLETMEPVVLTVTEPLPPTSTSSIATRAFMDQVREKTNGKVDFEVYEPGVLHGLADALPAIESGLTDITMIGSTFVAETMPGFSWTAGLGTYATGATPQDLLAGLPAAQVNRNGSASVMAELSEHNAVPLGAMSSDGFSLLCREPVATLEQAQGKLVRTTGGIWAEQVEALGMTNVFLENAELFDGLQRGVIDCLINTPSSFLALGVGEIAKYYTPIQFTITSGSTYVINKETFDSLPAEAQDIINEAKALIPIVNNREVAAQHLTWLQEAPKMGVEFLDVEPALAEKLREIQLDIAAKLPETAPANFADPEQTITTYQDVYDEWGQILADEFGIEENDGSIQAIEEAYAALATDFDWDAYIERFVAYLADYGY